MATSATLPNDTIIDGRYRVIRPIGRGGMGEVYEVEAEKSDTRFALKILIPELTHSKKAAARFEREVKTAARLKHDNIVKYMSAGYHNGVPYFVMELLQGSSLRSEMSRRERYAPDECWRILKPICGALAYAHENGVIHRDISPENIFVCHDGAPKLLDFGLVHEEDAQEGLTKTGASIGKQAYMAPEQRTDSSSVDASADVYSIGAVLFEMLTNELPIGIQTARQYVPHLSKNVDNVLRRTLAPRGERITNATELLQAIEQCEWADLPLAPKLARYLIAPATRALKTFGLAGLRGGARVIQRGTLALFRAMAIHRRTTAVVAAIPFVLWAGYSIRESVTTRVNTIYSDEWALGIPSSRSIALVELDSLGTEAYVATANSIVRVNLLSGENHSILDFPELEVRGCCFSAGFVQAAAYLPDKAVIQIGNLVSQTLTTEIPIDDYTPLTIPELQFLEQDRIAALKDNDLYIFDAVNGEQKLYNEFHYDSEEIMFGPDADYVAAYSPREAPETISVDSDSSITFPDLTYEEDDADAIRLNLALAFAGQDALVLICQGYDKSMYAVHLALPSGTIKQKVLLEDSDGPISVRLRIEPDLNLLVAGYNIREADDRITAWDIATGERRWDRVFKDVDFAEFQYFLNTKQRIAAYCGIDYEDSFILYLDSLSGQTMKTLRRSGDSWPRSIARSSNDRVYVRYGQSKLMFWRIN